MNYSDYLRNVRSVHKAVKREREKAKFNDSQYSVSYLRCKAAKQALLPNSTMSDITFYKEVISSHLVAENDLIWSYIPQQVQIIGRQAVLKRNTKEPKIFVTFQMGSYNIIKRILAKNKINFIIVYDAKMSKQDELLRQELGSKIRFVDKNAPHLLTNLQAAVQDGFHILYYMECMINTDPARLIEVNFLSGKIQTCTCIADLSQQLGLPIVPVLSYRIIWSEVVVRFYETLVPNLLLDTKEYAIQTTQKIWSIFEAKLKQQPHQWAGWFKVGEIPLIN